MKNYKMITAYDGTRFFGWEHQPDKDTIQGKLEAVLGELNGVHARAMVANVQLTTDLSDTEIRFKKIRHLTSSHLPTGG